MIFFQVKKYVYIYLNKREILFVCKFLRKKNLDGNNTHSLCFYKRITLYFINFNKRAETSIVILCCNLLSEFIVLINERT